MTAEVIDMLEWQIRRRQRHEEDARVLRERRQRREEEKRTRREQKRRLRALYQRPRGDEDLRTLVERARRQRPEENTRPCFCPKCIHLEKTAAEAFGRLGR